MYNELPRSFSFDKLVLEIINGAKSATKYISPNLVARAVRFGKFDSQGLDVRVKLGRPNFAERKFIKLCKKAGEPFPVKKIQLTFSKKEKKS